MLGAPPGRGQGPTSANFGLGLERDVGALKSGHPQAKARPIFPSAQFHPTAIRKLVPAPSNCDDSRGSTDEDASTVGVSSSRPAKIRRTIGLDTPAEPEAEDKLWSVRCDTNSSASGMVERFGNRSGEYTRDSKQHLPQPGAAAVSHSLQDVHCELGDEEGDFRAGPAKTSLQWGGLQVQGAGGARQQNSSEVAGAPTDRDRERPAGSPSGSGGEPPKQPKSLLASRLQATTNATAGGGGSSSGLIGRAVTLTLA